MWIPLRFQTNHSKLQSVWFLEFPSTVQADLLGEPGVSTYQKKIAGAYQPGSVPPTPGAAKEGTGGKKMGISAAVGTVNQTSLCVFIGSDLDGAIGSDLDGNASRTASCWDPTTVDFYVFLFWRWGGEVGSGGVAAPLAFAWRGRVRLDQVED